MVEKIRLNRKPCVIKLVIGTREREKIWIKVSDLDRKNTFYTKRYSNIRGRKAFFVNMPQAPEVAKIKVYNDDRDMGLGRRDRSFKVLDIQVLPLILPPLQASKKTRSFIKFAQEFSDECGYLSASERGDVYRSNNGKFRIDYFTRIRSKNTGKVISTPARISQLTGKIEVSAKQFRRYTIPMRMAILMHEYSHYYLNKTPSDESEADINGLRLYLGLGYPKIDLYNVFLNVFKRSPSGQNKERFDKLDNFVKKWREENE